MRKVPVFWRHIFLVLKQAKAVKANKLNLDVV